MKTTLAKYLTRENQRVKVVHGSYVTRGVDFDPSYEQNVHFITPGITKIYVDGRVQRVYGAGELSEELIPDLGERMQFWARDRIEPEELESRIDIFLEQHAEREALSECE